MTKVIEAIFTHGILEPLESLQLPENQRVEITVRPLNGAAVSSAVPEVASTPQELDSAIDELLAEIDRMDLHLRIRLPTRDEMHERG